MNNIQRISFCEERNELILPIIGLTLSESNIFLKNGVRTLIVNKKGEKNGKIFPISRLNLITPLTCAMSAIAVASCCNLIRKCDF